MALEMRVQLPEATASATVVKAELKYEWVMQPRSQGPQKWQGPRPLRGLVRFALRVGMTVRPSFSLTRSRKRVSWQVRGNGGWKLMAGSWSGPSELWVVDVYFCT